MPPPDSRLIIAIDPGRSKCGYAVVEGAPQGPMVRRLIGVVTLAELLPLLAEMGAGQAGVIVIVGSGTGSAAVREALAAAGIQAVPVEERFTTERARRRYFQENPPRGWRRLLPLSLQTPPCPVDDYAALILAEQWIASQPPAGAAPADPPSPGDAAVYREPPVE